MAGASFDKLPNQDQWPDPIIACQEGTNVTAVRDDPDDGPVRPTFQQLDDRTNWLRNGVVYGKRSIAKLYASKKGGGGAVPATLQDGDVSAEGDLSVGDFLTVGLDADLRRDLSVKRDVFIGGQFVAALFGQVGLSVSENIQITPSRFYWNNVGTLPGPSDSSVRNALCANQVCKHWGSVRFDTGAIAAQSGVGGWTCRVVDAASESPRFRVTFDAFTKFASGDDYSVTHSVLSISGTARGATSVKLVEQTDSYFDVCVYDSSGLMNLKLNRWRFNFQVFGNQ